MVQTIRNQIKAYKIQNEKNSRTTIKVNSPLLAWLPRHAPWQYTPFHKRQDSATIREDSTHVLPKPNLVVNKLESAWLEGVWLGRDRKTDEHLIGTPSGMISKPCIENAEWNDEGGF